MTLFTSRSVLPRLNRSAIPCEILSQHRSPPGTGRHRWQIVPRTLINIGEQPPAPRRNPRKPDPFENLSTNKRNRPPSPTTQQRRDRKQREQESGRTIYSRNGSDGKRFPDERVTVPEGGFGDQRRRRVVSGRRKTRAQDETEENLEAAKRI